MSIFEPFWDTEDTEDPLPIKRKVIQLTSDDKHIYALCNDGTMWKFMNQATGWEQLKQIPKD